MIVGNRQRAMNNRSRTKEHEQWPTVSGQKKKLIINKLTMGFFIEMCILIIELTNIKGINFYA